MANGEGQKRHFEKKISDMYFDLLCSLLFLDKPELRILVHGTGGFEISRDSFNPKLEFRISLFCFEPALVEKRQCILPLHLIWTWGYWRHQYPHTTTILLMANFWGCSFMSENSNSQNLTFDFNHKLFFRFCHLCLSGESATRRTQRRHQRSAKPPCR